MIVVDSNLLLYAYNPRSAFHLKSKAWLEDILSDREPVGLPWLSISAFIRISTHANLSVATLSTQQAVEIVDSWIDQPNVAVLAPGEKHWVHFRRMLAEGQARGPLATDAHLAAITVEYGGVLHSSDRDFARFPGLRWKNPIV